MTTKKLINATIYGCTAIVIGFIVLFVGSAMVVGIYRGSTGHTVKIESQDAGVSAKIKQNGNDNKPTKEAKKSAIDQSPATQESRRKVIADAVKYGIFDRVETPAKYPHVWVKPAFYALDFKRKQDLIGCVYGYHFNPSSDQPFAVLLYDSKTGNEVGNFHENNPGLKMH